MRFVVDGMLGGLARWLRILGHEVRYDSHAADNDLLVLASGNEMILLTRDEELCQRAQARGIPALLVSGKGEGERLSEVAQKYLIPLTIDMTLTRCPKCGSGLLEASKEEVGGRVPPKSLKMYSEFWKCANAGCEKIYWMGSHWKQINQTLSQARQLSGLGE